MIPRDRFNNIETGEIILFKNGRLRKVIGVTKCINKRVRKKPRVILRFNKILGFGTTLYLWNDIKHDIIGIYKIKTL